MRRVLYYIFFIVSVSVCLSSCSKEDDQVSYPSTRAERNFILKGNKAFEGGNYEEAANFYREALNVNPESPEALFNNAVATMTIAEQMMAKQGGEQPDSAALKLADESAQMYMRVSTMRDRATGLAACACYNLANHYFRVDNLDEAEVYYRQSLRLAPDFDEARRNLRITQLKKQQNKDQDKKENEQNQEQNQDQNKESNQNQNQDQDQKNKEQDQEQNNQQQQQPKPQSNMTEQAAQQILNANNAREQSTRARLERVQQQQGQPGGRRGKKW